MIFFYDGHGREDVLADRATFLDQMQKYEDRTRVYVHLRPQTARQLRFSEEEIQRHTIDFVIEQDDDSDCESKS